MRALCEAAAMLLSKNITCAGPRCNATSSKHFPHTSHCTLHTSHLSSFHLVSCLPICQLRSSWLFSCHLGAAQTFSCVGPTFNLSRRFCRQTTFCTCSVSTQQHGRSVYTIICQGNAVLFCQGIVLFRANSCQGFETTSAESIFEVTQTNIPALLGWDTSSAREAQ